MADRKATNRYYPPEFWDDPKFSDKSNLNSFRGEGWRNRGAQVNSKLLTQGRNVIRFETPFDIWCEGCNEVIHKGVRFNADKEKVRLAGRRCAHCPNSARPLPPPSPRFPGAAGVVRSYRSSVWACSACSGERGTCRCSAVQGVPPTLCAPALCARHTLPPHAAPHTLLHPAPTSYAAPATMCVAERAAADAN